jgi:hypothetical protein
MRRGIVVLSGIFAVLCVHTGISTAASLRDVDEVPKLRIAPDKVRLSEHHDRSLPPSARAKDRERPVGTKNLRLVAYQHFDEKGVCRLRLVGAVDGVESTIGCNSADILIPKDKDIVWVAGGAQGDDKLHEGKSAPSGGLRLYDAHGTQLADLPASRTGTITILKLLDDGTLFFVGFQGKNAHVGRVSSEGRIATEFQLSTPPNDLRVFNGGDYLAVKSRQWEQNKQVATLLDKEGKTVSEFSDTTEVSPEIVAVTQDAAHVIVAKNLQRPGQRYLAVHDLRGKTKPERTVKVDFYPSDLLVTDDLSHFVTQRFQGRGVEGENQSFEILDGTGNIISHYDCTAGRGAASSSWADNQKRVDWVCGDKHLRLEMK